MSAGVLISNRWRIPGGVNDLESFRRWARSRSFPKRGRIDFVGGRIEFDMSPDNLYFHTAPKSELGRVIGNRLVQTEIGQWFIDKTRVSCPAVGLSVEPDIVLVTDQSLAEGRVQLTPSRRPTPDSFVEIVGPLDLIVEIVSDKSVTKDKRRLKRKYFEAGVREYWIVDARGDALEFVIHHRSRTRFAAAPADETGYQQSLVLETAYWLEKRRGRSGHWTYRLHERTPS
jgi:Uma2 family endonuclease